MHWRSFWFPRPGNFKLRKTPTSLQEVTILNMPLLPAPLTLAVTQQQRDAIWRAAASTSDLKNNYFTVKKLLGIRIFIEDLLQIPDCETTTNRACLPVGHIRTKVSFKHLLCTSSFINMNLMRLSVLSLFFAVSFGTRFLFDSCKSTSQCTRGATCATVRVEDGEGELLECTESSFSLLCICFPNDSAARCRQSSDCREGEMCSNQIQGGEQMGRCMSRSLAAWAAGINTAIEITEPGMKPSTDEGLELLNDGYTGYPCRSASECAGSRVCYSIFSESEDSRCSNERHNLFCLCTRPELVPKECTGNDCGDGEMCGNEVDVEQRVDRSLCISKAMGERLADRINGRAKDEVCVAVHHLEDLSQEELVYKHHRLASVLCDRQGSCATPGHIVLHNGRSMRMSSYCSMVLGADDGCVSQTMYVNSVRYTRGRVVQSQTEGLLFTVFAARFDSRAEEAVLGMALRLGM